MKEKSREKIKAKAVLTHFPGNWESVFTLGKEPGHMWGIKRKTTFFFLFFTFSGFLSAFLTPQLLNILLNKNAATPGRNHALQS